MFMMEIMGENRTVTLTQPMHQAQKPLNMSFNQEKLAKEGDLGKSKLKKMT